MHTYAMRTLAVALAALLTAAAVAQDMGRDPTAQPPQQAQLQTGQQQAGADFLVRASDLMGYRVINRRGEQLGEIHDMAVYPQEGRLGFFVISYGSFLGLGHKLVAVPLERLTLQLRDKTALLDMSKAQFQELPAFNTRAWPSEPQVQ